MAEPAGSSQEVAANLNLAASLLLFASVGLAVLVQSDAELVLPSSRFDLGGLLERFKDGVPGGAFVLPLLRVQVPLILFYTLGPAALVLLHGALLLRPGLLELAARPLRITITWLPPLVLLLIRWRFAPYVTARPWPQPASGFVLEGLQTAALVADLALIAAAGTLRRALPTENRIGRWSARLRAGQAAGLLCLIGIMFSGLPRLASEELRPGLPVAPPGPAEIAMAAGGLLLLVVWIGAAHPRPAGRHTGRGGLDMLDRLCLAALLGLVLLPVPVRALDLQGQDLVAQAPSETMMAALIVGARWSPAPEPEAPRLAELRRQAWTEYGRGIDLSGWNFPRGRFERATMAKMRLASTDLRAASLDFANLVGANLAGAWLAGASMRYADLSDSSWAGARIQLAQAPASAGSRTAAARSSLDLTGANLAGADLRNADLSNAVLTGVNLQGAQLQGAQLRGARLDNSNLQGAMLQRADLTGASLCRADLRRVNFSDAAGLSNAFLNGADLAGAVLPRALQGGHLQGANLFGAQVSPAPTSQDVPITWQELVGQGLRQVDSLADGAKPALDTSLSCPDPMPAAPR
jgi:uncharacterized protein YjbI with pentapeptide repeats